MILDIPASSLARVLVFCSPCEWGRARVVHRSASFDDDFLLRESGTATDSNLALGDAARCGSLLTVLARLQQAEDPNARDKKHPKYTPLHRATSGGHRSVVRLLLSWRANANLRDRLGFCALHYAANQSIGLVKDLLEASCDVNAINLMGVAPLHSAAGMGRVDVCELFLAAGARSCATGSGATPASMARRAIERLSGPLREACADLVARLDAMDAMDAIEDVGDGRATVWCFLEDVGTWTPFDEASAAILSSAPSSGEDDVILSVHGRTYLADLGALTQTNATTGTVRRIEQRNQSSASSVVDASWVPAALGHWDGLVSARAQRLPL